MHVAAVANHNQKERFYTRYILGERETLRIPRRRFRGRSNSEPTTLFTRTQIEAAMSASPTVRTRSPRLAPPRISRSSDEATPRHPLV